MEMSLAENQFMSENAAGAVETGERMVSHLRESVGYTSPITLSAVASLARYYEALGNEEETLSLRRYVYEKRAEVLGREEKDTLISGCELVTSLIRNGEIEPALDLGNEILNPVRKTFGRVNPYTLQLIQDLKEGLAIYDSKHEEGEE